MAECLAVPELWASNLFVAYLTAGFFPAVFVCINLILIIVCYPRTQQVFFRIFEMGLLKRIFGVNILFLFLFCAVNEAKALSFAGFAYQNARQANIIAIKNYLKKGYKIDSISPNGYTALCYAAAYNDYPAYSRLRNLGADENHECMQKVNPAYVQDLAQRYDAVASHPNYASNLADSDTTKKYLIAGTALAGTAAAVALLADSGSGGSSGNTNRCPIGQEWDGEQCIPIICPDGTHLEGNNCVSCPTGQKWDGSKCIPIICPDNTHLVGNDCVADDINIDNDNDKDVYGIYSEEEDVYNLRSDSEYPDKEANINIDNKGNGNVYGIYGFGNIKNSGVTDAEADGEANVGVGNITINNQGTGNVFGIYSHVEDISILKEAYIAMATKGGTAYGNLEINNQGGGTATGVYGDVRAYNARGNFGGKAYGNITIRNDGDIYGLSGYTNATNVITFNGGGEAKGVINLYSKGDGDIYGMAVSPDGIPGVGQPEGGEGQLANWFAYNSVVYSDNSYDWTGKTSTSAEINIHNIGDGNVYGMYGGQTLQNAIYQGVVDGEGNVQGLADGLISIVNHGNGDVYGMYTLGGKDGTPSNIGNVTNDGAHSVINIVNSGDGVSTGLRGGQGGYIENSGEININNLGNGTAVGIYGGANSNIVNSGTINIYRKAYVDDEMKQTYTPESATGGTAYGIYAETGSHVINAGTITVTGADKGAGIYLEAGATFENSGDVKFNGSSDSAIQEDGEAIDIYGDGTDRASVDLNDIGGEIILGQGGRFFADSLKGDMSVSEKNVLGGFDNQYVLTGALQADDVDELNLNSKSAMFEATSQKNENGGYDVVMTRQNFKDIIDDDNISGYLENNYVGENGSKIFDSLKTAGDKGTLNQKAANLLGTDMLPNFRREDALLYRNLSRQFNDNLFNQPNQNYIGGYKYVDISTDADGTLMGTDGQAHVAYGMMKNKGDNGVTYGLGASIAKLNSDYDNGSKRDANIFGVWAPVGYDFKNGAQWYSKLYLGYVDGSYDRITDLQKYSADMNEYQYGLSNEVRYDLSLGGGFTFSPLAELNLFGVYSDGYDEGNDEGAIHTDSQNDLSLEGGLGAYLAKKVDFSDDSHLTVQIGGVYYVEFLDPDDGFDASVSALDGKYKLSHKSDDGRAVLSARVNYNYKDITIYGNIEKETSNDKSLLIDAGVQYKF